MPEQFIYHYIYAKENLTKVQLHKDNSNSEIYVEKEEFENDFFNKIFGLYNQIHFCDDVHYLLMPDEVRYNYLNNLPLENLEEVLEYVQGIETVIDSIRESLCFLIDSINLKKTILSDEIAHFSPSEILMRYIYIGLLIIDNDYKDFNAKYIRNINYTFSRLIQDVLTLLKLKETVEDIKSNKPDESFFVEVESQHSDTSSTKTVKPK